MIRDRATRDDLPALERPAPGLVHVWLADLDDGAWPVGELRASLAPEEAARADRFHFDVHRRRYTVGRGLLRRLLGSYTGRAPSRVPFRYGAAGKPELPRDEIDAGDLRFNVSHSDSCGAFAFSTGREIGVDVECFRPVSDMAALATRFFASGESRALTSIPTERRREAFFHCWTRKEAYVKAVGGGLSVDLGGFEVSVDPDEETASLRSDDAEAWTLRSFRPRDGAAGCVAAAGSGWDLALRRLAPDTPRGRLGLT